MNSCNPPAPREWRCDRELGCIAGTRPMGLGRFFARFDEDCDGTIGVSETKLPGPHRARDAAREPHGHAAVAAVARQVANFLDDGRFQ